MSGLPRHPLGSPEWAADLAETCARLREACNRVRTNIARHQAWRAQRGVTVTTEDKARAAIVEAIKYWTEDPDRCDMEGREHEVAETVLERLDAARIFLEE